MTDKDDSVPTATAGQAQREHASVDPVIEALNLTFYRRCKALGIETYETLAQATGCRYTCPEQVRLGD